MSLLCKNVKISSRIIQTAAADAKSGDGGAGSKEWENRIDQLAQDVAQELDEAMEIYKDEIKRKLRQENDKLRWQL